MKAMILAAGLGARLRPVTNTLPKALINVGGVPMLERVINHLKTAGVKEIVINTHHLAPKIMDFLIANGNFGLRIEISHEEKILDTGGALKKAAPFFGDGKPFFLYNADILTDFDLKFFQLWHLREKPLASLAVMNRKSARKFHFDGKKVLSGWENKKTGELVLCRFSAGPAAASPACPATGGLPEGGVGAKLAFCGVHLLSPEIFDHFPAKEVFSMTEFYLELAAKGLKISGFSIDGALWHDIGDPEKLKKARESME
ncbi:MAG: nucleotidyltransferase [Elusimicrobia bacterium CG08_land_8_20_14_0_20_51_18]|nr:MAG: nucleotidyltransferase [Elusimicrobia bacterium CG08_land_8_20_14_0_20_51_18]